MRRKGLGKEGWYESERIKKGEEDEEKLRQSFDRLSRWLYLM